MMIRWLIGLFGALLLGQGLWLIAGHIIHFGTLLPCLIGSVFLLWAFKRAAWSRLLAASKLRLFVWRVVLLGFGLWVLSLMLFFVWQASRVPSPVTAQPSVIVSLSGGSINQQPTPEVVERLNATLAMAKRYPESQVIATGGLAKGATDSEAQIMANYLVAQGLAPQRLSIETHSTSTHENFLFTKTMLSPGDSILIVSSDYHVPRAEKIARRLQLNVVGSWPATTPIKVRYNDWLREYFAYISGWLLKEY
jgi:uncharacterized SAM-binding protein YcdF (DUF218 family)